MTTAGKDSIAPEVAQGLSRAGEDPAATTECHENDEEVSPCLVNRVWGNWGEYTLDPKWREWALSQLGLAGTPIRVDLFAEPWSATVPTFITAQMDCFSYNWGKLQAGSDELLWANPPFRLLTKVAKKIGTEPCWLALCTPEKPDDVWWAILAGYTHRRVQLPQRVRLFFGGFCKTALPQRPWRTVVWVVDTRALWTDGPNALLKAPGKGWDELKQALDDVPRVMWSHGKQGGKPLLEKHQRVPVAECATNTDSQPLGAQGTEVATQTTPSESERIDHLQGHSGSGSLTPDLENGESGESDLGPYLVPAAKSHIAARGLVIVELTDVSQIAEASSQTEVSWSAFDSVSHSSAKLGTSGSHTSGERKREKGTNPGERKEETNPGERENGTNPGRKENGLTCSGMEAQDLKRAICTLNLGVENGERESDGLTDDLSAQPVQSDSSASLEGKHEESMVGPPTVILNFGMKVQNHAARPPTGVLEPHLRVAMVLQWGDGQSRQVMALLDTGAEVNLVKHGLLPNSALREATRPLRLLAANNLQLLGGDREALVDICFQGRHVETKELFPLTTESALYEAEMEEDVILSYQWMGERDIQVAPRAHGFWVESEGNRIWVAGLRGYAQQRANARLPRVPVNIRQLGAVIKDDFKPRALDMFCGRKSAAKVLEKHGFEVVTLDNDPKRDPTICSDVLTWDFWGMYPPGYFDLIVACPPCTEYSAAMTKRPRKMEEADEVVRKTLEIIRYFQPDRWWLETPRNGRLTKRKVVEGLPFVDVDYCRFEDCGYQKPTRFFGSDHVLGLDPYRCDGRQCPGLVWKRQPKKGQQLPHRWHKGGGTGHVDRETAYHIPEGVIEYVSGLAPGPPPWMERTEETVEEQFIRLTIGDPVFVRAVEEMRSWNISAIQTEHMSELDLRKQMITSTPSKQPMRMRRPYGKWPGE